MPLKSMKDRRQSDSANHAFARPPVLKWETTTGTTVPENAFYINEAKLCVAKIHTNLTNITASPIKTFVGPFIPGRGLPQMKVNDQDVSATVSEVQILTTPNFETTWRQINGEFNPRLYGAIPVNVAPNIFIAKVKSKEGVGVGTIYLSTGGSWMIIYGLENKLKECKLTGQKDDFVETYDVLSSK